MKSSPTTNLEHGVTNANPWQVFGSAGLPDPAWAAVYHDDFVDFLTGKYNITIVGTGSGAPTNYDGGALLLTNSAGASDSTVMQCQGAAFAVGGSRKTFYKAKIIASDQANQIMAGLGSVGTTYAGITDGIFVRKGTGGALVLDVKVGGVTTTYALGPTFVAATATEVGFTVDESGEISVFIGSTSGNSPVPAGNLRGPAFRVSPAALPTALLTPTLCFINGSAATRTLTVDFQTAARHR